MPTNPRRAIIKKGKKKKRGRFSSPGLKTAQAQHGFYQKPRNPRPQQNHTSSTSTLQILTP
jgi:hypothetical protein